MKKIIALMMVAVLLFAWQVLTSVTSTKLDRSSQVSIKGNWVITNITTPGSNYIAINSFQIADSKCFIGSTWNFISNNNKGSMNLQNRIVLLLVLQLFGVLTKNLNLF